jgi:hypothetical protein
MRAKSNFTLSLVAAALALPGPALALGLGRLTVDSALGQPLQARIELTSASRDELDTLSAKVADPSLYRQNNLAYQGALSRTRITLERTADGNAFLRVSSPTAINEPYLDLLVEVNWASGRVVRDYTFLLDPPGIAIAAAVEPATPARVGASAPRTQQQGADNGRSGAAPGGRGLHGETRRHIVEDRQRSETGGSDPRPDAGCIVQVERERIRRQQHEPVAHRGNHDDPECGGSDIDGGTGSNEGSSRCRRRTGAVIAIALLGQHRKRKARADVRPPERSEPRSRRKPRRQRQVATSCGLRATRRAKAPARPKRLSHATSSCVKHRRASPSSNGH